MGVSLWGGLYGGDPKEESLWGEFLWVSLWGCPHCGTPMGRVAMGMSLCGGSLCGWGPMEKVSLWGGYYGRGGHYEVSLWG